MIDLAAIRERVEACGLTGSASYEWLAVVDDAAALLAEVERLRAALRESQQHRCPFTPTVCGKILPYADLVPR